MPEMTVPSGEKRKIVDGSQAKGAWNVSHVSGGRVQLDHRSQNVSGNPSAVVEEDDRTTIRNLGGTEVWAYVSPSDADATIRVSEGGFLINYEPRTTYDTDITAQSIGELDTGVTSFTAGPIDVNADITAQSVGNIDTGVTSWTAGSISVNSDISAQSIGDLDVNLNSQSLASNLDINFDAQTQNVEMDVAAQSLNNLASDTQVVSAEGVTEVNADQTADIADGATQTSTVRADSGEVWSLRSVLFDFSGPDINTGAEHYEALVETEQEGITLARGRLDDEGGDLDGGFALQAGEWVNNAAFGVLDVTLTDYRDAKIDDTHGVNFVFVNQSGQTISADRKWRAQFEVTQVE